MPILVEVAAVPVTEAEKAEIVARAIKEFLAAPLAGYTDPATGGPITHHTAIKRGATAYPYVVSGGHLEKRVTKLETTSAEQAANILGVAGKVAAVELRTQTIEAALDEPILDQP